MNRSLALALLALGLTPAVAAAQQALLGAVERTQHGDTLVLTLRLAGQPGVHVSEPFHLEDRVRLHLDLDLTGSTVDSAALAALAGGDLIALDSRPRAGGTALVVDVRELAAYRMVQHAGAVALHLLPRAPAIAAPPAAATPAPVRTAAPPAPGRAMTAFRSLQRSLPASPLLLLAAAPAALLLLGRRRRRAPAALGAAAGQRGAANGAATTSPEAVRMRADGRLWAVRTLAASGASTADVVRRTGVPRDAIRFLEADRPAVSAASGSYYRTPAAGRAPQPVARAG